MPVAQLCPSAPWLHLRVLKLRVSLRRWGWLFGLFESSMLTGSDNQLILDPAVSLAGNRCITMSSGYLLRALAGLLIPQNMSALSNYSQFMYTRRAEQPHPVTVILRKDLMLAPAKGHAGPTLLSLLFHP